MIVVDTNVLSQPLREDGERRVIEWLDRHDVDVRIPAQSVAELVYGYEKLDFGRRRTELHDAIFSLLTRYRDRVLPFDRAAAEAHGWLFAKLEKQGQTPSFANSQIAAIAISRGAKVATRNTADFAPSGIDLINPWTA